MGRNGQTYSNICTCANDTTEPQRHYRPALSHLCVLHELAHKQSLILLGRQVLQNIDLLRLDVRRVAVAAEKLRIVITEPIRRLLHQ